MLTEIIPQLCMCEMCFRFLVFFFFCVICCSTVPSSPCRLIMVMTEPFAFLSSDLILLAQYCVRDRQCTGTQKASENYNKSFPLGLGKVQQTSRKMRELEGTETMQHAISIYLSLSSLGLFCWNHIVFLVFNSLARSFFLQCPPPTHNYGGAVRCHTLCLCMHQRLMEFIIRH